MSVVIVLVAGCSESDPAPTLELLTPTESGNLAAVTPSSSMEPSPTLTPSATTMLPTATATSTATSTATPTPSPTATSTPNPTATPTATPEPTATVAEGSVSITAILNDPPVGRDADGETVTIVNIGESAVDMTGWTLSDIAEHVFQFPTFVLQPGASVVVHICDGEDSAEILFWGRCSAIWNNEGDTAFLKDATGREISTFSY